ncbi:hypothetical protein H6F86_03945 [Phormidium sp. FACHB-592]|uniref:Novel STAND NTPase 1 domain-containing protein n=1 Tax=Stenomitos frigidus AS-A4 TaxID=2933935 RepID=A0ABV0KQM1_9CYAN|nr:hypothetical protein [Phormidium sp. FACHB-592]MBD2073052.1 hypothetical protein [Phormidium sp. FACHB-592]
MVAPDVEEILIHNQDALEELAWAIEASQGQFSLTLARCNYASLRGQLVIQIQKACTVKLLVTPLQQTSQTLYTRLRELTDATPVEALMVLGLESVDALEEMLPAVNSVREEFRKHFSFPIVFWITDAVHSKLVQLAPDFESWATTTDFTLPPNALLDALRNASDRLFSTLLTPDSNRSFRRLLENLDLGFLQRAEVEAAVRDLQKTGHSLTPDLQATLEFLRGLNASTNQEALEHFQRSLEYWQGVSSEGNKAIGGQEPDVRSQTSESSPPDLHFTPPYLPTPSPNLIAGLLLYFVGRTLYNLCSENKYRQENWEPPKQPLQECLRVFEQANRPDLVAKSMTQMERTLEKLKAWEALEALVQKSLPLQQIYDKPVRQAVDYRYLALTAIQRGQGADAKRYAERALEIIEQVSEEHRYRGLYLLTLAEAMKLTGQREASLSRLNEARSLGDQGIPQVYIAILEALRTHYIEQKDYLEAFRLKQERLAVEQQYQLRAFVGAGRLRAQRQDQEVLRSQTTIGTTERTVLAAENLPTGIASWQRQRDVKQLVERIGRNDCKLIVIHGYSGVGKSSLISAGLVPTLEQKAIGLQVNLPVVVRKYTDWAEELERRMAEVLGGVPSASTTPNTRSPTPQALITQLRHNEQRNLRTILIFDQFEEFFFVYPTPAQRRPFFEFLGQCLQLLLVKVVLPLREDYLYYLLEFNRIPEISTTGIDVLSRNVLYPLGNFVPDDARVIIQELTEQARFYLELELVEALVTDLTDENGEVRPIELQIVGAQLQTDGIRDLEAYSKLREAGKPAKEVLVERYLAEVVADCGTDNQRAAELVLYLLTDENNTRPLKTRAELAEDMGEETTKLDFVLEILVRSGLVMLLPEIPADRYQLVHDYLVRYIRQQQGEDLLAELAKERLQRKLSDEKLKRFLKRALISSITTGIGFAVLATVAISFWLSAEGRRKQVEVAEINALNSVSEAKLVAHNQLEAIVAGVQAGQRVKQTMASSELKNKTVDTLRKAITDVQELNRLEGHTGRVFSTSFSPDGKLLVSSSADGSVKLWKRDGSLVKTLIGHKGQVWIATFSPDGKVLVSASGDGKIRLWNREGSLVKTLKGHTGGVTSISFIPKSNIFASAGDDEKIRLWNQDGTLIGVFPAHKYINSLSFSADGQVIASASNDNTVKLWKRDGTLLHTLSGHKDVVWSVSFSPDGQTLASASYDNTVKLWNRDGKPLKTFQRHTNRVLGVGFSPDGKAVASASLDSTIIVWRLDGEVLTMFQGHSGGVRSVNFSPDGKALVSAGLDKTIRLWKHNDLFKSLRGHKDKIRSVALSPNGQIIASSSKDKTIKIWNYDGALLETIAGSAERVANLTFSPNNELVAGAKRDGTVKLWRLNGGSTTTLRSHNAAALEVKFSPDGQILASASEDKTIKLWSRNGKLLETLQGHQNDVNGLSFSPNGRILASGSQDDTIKLWNRNGMLLKTISTNQEGVTKVSFSPDGQFLASAGLDNTVKLWNYDGSLARVLFGHQNRVWSVNFSPDSQLIASGDANGVINIWSREGIRLQTFEDRTFSIWEVGFNPDGQLLASASDDITIKLWKLDLQKLNALKSNNLDNLLQQSCQWLNSYLRTNETIRPEEKNLCPQP